jgi:hypothetical protein
MAFSKKQQVTAWLGLLFMAAMVVYPPWFWEGGSTKVSSRQFEAGYAWLWAPPPSPPDYDWHPVIRWSRLRDQLLVVAVGMLLLLFLREARERVNKA